MTEEKEALIWLNMQTGVKRRPAQLSLRPQGWRETVRAEMERAERAGVAIVTVNEPGYPEPLRCLEDAPPVLYISGSYRSGDEAALALVGSRQADSYGLRVAAAFSRELAGCGVVTVSGMAEGIDTCVHERTIDSGGRTLAVLGSGLGQLYPRDNAVLARRIRESGAVISEFPMDYPPYQANFPRRNRIIAGLSLGTILIEAAERSGALITARLAAEQGKDVFAVPGPVNSPLSRGTHRLIQQGAKLVCSAREVLEEIEELKGLLGSLPPDKGEGRDGSNATGGNYRLSDFEKTLLSRLGEEPVQMDKLVQTLGRKPQELAVSLVALEMRGLVQTVPGNAYVRAA